MEIVMKQDELIEKLKQFAMNYHATTPNYKLIHKAIHALSNGSEDNETFDKEDIFNAVECGFNAGRNYNVDDETSEVIRIINTANSFVYFVLMERATTSPPVANDAGININSPDCSEPELYNTPPNETGEAGIVEKIDIALSELQNRWGGYYYSEIESIRRMIQKERILPLRSTPSSVLPDDMKGEDGYRITEAGVKDLIDEIHNSPDLSLFNVEKIIREYLTPNPPAGEVSEEDFEGAELWKHEYDMCRDILKELVEVKIINDTEGKTIEYINRQPKAWESAKEFLKQYQHQ